MVDNTKYDMKTIKIRPNTYSKLVKARAKHEYNFSELHSFDNFIDLLLEGYLQNEDTLTNDPKKV